VKDVKYKIKLITDNKEEVLDLVRPKWTEIELQGVVGTWKLQEG
jgi:hypothetical protein